MAAPVYSTDLTDITTSESTTGWSALGGGASGLSVEPDFTIQGSNCIAKQIKAETKGHHFSNGTTTIGAADHIFIWLYVSTPGTTDTLANGGLRITTGTAAGNRFEYYVAGNDTYAKGGWFCYPLRTSFVGDATVGSPTFSPTFFGAVMKGIVTVKAPNLGIDAIRIGSSISMTAGDATDPATFTGLAEWADETSRSYGIIQTLDSGALLQGECQVGTAATAAHNVQESLQFIFPNNNPSTLIQKTLPDFKKITINHASTVVDWSNVSVLSLDLVDKGFIQVIAASTVDISACAFQNMGTNIFNTATTVEGSSFNNCQYIDAAGATFTDCSILPADQEFSFVDSGESYAVAQGSGLTGVTFNNDGTKMFVVDDGTDAVYEYTIATGYDLSSTVTYTTNSYTFTQAANPREIVFNGDGTTMFTCDFTTAITYEYSVATGFDLNSTITYTGNSYDASTQVTGRQTAIEFNSAGTKMFIPDDSTSIIYEYTVATAFDLSSTVTYTTRSFDASTQEQNIRSIIFNSDGTKLFVGGTGTAIYEYDLTTAYTLDSGVTYTNRRQDVSLGNSEIPMGMRFNDTEDKIFIVSTIADDIFEFHINDRMALTTTDLDTITNNRFVSFGAGHAVELTSIGSGSMSWENETSGYAVVNGSTGNEDIFVNVSTGTLDIQVPTGVTTPSIRTAGATVNIVKSAVTLTIIVTDPNKNLITDSTVSVLVEATAGGPLAVGTDIIKGFTDINGEISATAIYNTSQPFSGWARKGTSPPYYKQNSLSGTIDNDNGLTLTIIMVSDE